MSDQLIEGKVIDMILQTLGETKEAITQQGQTLNALQVDVAVIKNDLSHMANTQEDMADRLAALEARPASKGFTIDNKTLLKLGGFLLVAILGVVTREIPPEVWKAVLAFITG